MMLTFNGFCGDGVNYAVTPSPKANIRAPMMVEYLRSIGEGELTCHGTMTFRLNDKRRKRRALRRLFGKTAARNA